jgi:hypothetical protein
MPESRDADINFATYRNSTVSFGSVHLWRRVRDGVLVAAVREEFSWSW